VVSRYPDLSRSDEETTMKVGFFQFDVALGDKARNLDRVVQALGAEDFDLLVLPEMFTTGYLFESREELIPFAEEVPEGETTQQLIAVARQKNAHIVGSIVEIGGDHVYNTAVVVGPEGLVGRHRKIHLPRFEVPLFDRGSDLQVFDLNGVRVGVVLCFEAWFPETSRILALKGAQVLCHPANFGGPWSLDMIRVRAMENVVYTVTANRIGREHQGGIDAEFRGESQIVNCEGDVLLRADDQQVFAVLEIDPERARDKSNLVCDDMMAELAHYDLYAGEGR
jgi:predicted amidohydrolase